MHQRTKVAAALATAAGGMWLAAAARAASPGATLDVDVNHPGAAIPPSFYGLMTEEINHSYDGGLLAELVQNRTFQDPATPAAASRRSPAAGRPAPALAPSDGGRRRWRTDRADPVNPALPVSLRLDLDGGRAGRGQRRLLRRPRPARHDLHRQLLRQGRRRLRRAGHGVDRHRRRERHRRLGRHGRADHHRLAEVHASTLKTGHDAAATAKARFVVGATGTGSRFVQPRVALPADVHGHARAGCGRT